MTKEEAIKLIDDRMCFGRGKWSEHHRPVIDEYWQAGEMAIKALGTEPHWIPVEQALPEEPFGCLVTVWDEEPMTGEMFENLLPYFVGWDGEQWNDGDGQQCPFEVIAWMPLPEPYKGGEQDG